MLISIDINSLSLIEELNIKAKISNSFQLKKKVFQILYGILSYWVMRNFVIVLFINTNRSIVRINLFIYLLRTFGLILVVLFFLCVVSSFTTFRPKFTPGFLQVNMTSDRNDESCNRIPSNYCLP